MLYGIDQYFSNTMALHRRIDCDGEYPKVCFVVLRRRFGRMLSWAGLWRRRCSSAAQRGNTSVQFLPIDRMSQEPGLIDKQQR